MEISDRRLDRDLIDDASMYSMLVRVDADSVDVVVYSTVVDGSLIYRSFPASGASRLKALEEVVYDNPLMLAEFRKVWILVDTKEYLMIPAGVEPDDVGKMYRFMYPANEGRVHTTELGVRNASIVFSLGDDIEGFVKRTFTGARLMPHIAPLVRYFATKPGRGNARRMLCNLRRSAMDVVVVDGNTLLQANTFTFNTPMDAAYCILASRAENSLDRADDEVLLTGDRDLRDELTTILRTYVPRVMPAIFPPQMFRAGREAMLAPFDLIITPLCE